jgi:hypothetical protein
MKVSEAFPGKWLKADDLPKGKKVKVTISDVGIEEMNGEKKLSLFFEGKDRGMIVNTTNRNILVSALGNETDDWTGKEVFIYAQAVSYQGRMVQGLKVDVPMAVAAEEEEPPF